MIKRLAGLAVVVFLLYYVAADPAGAQHLGHMVVAVVKSGAHGLAGFLSRL